MVRTTDHQKRQKTFNYLNIKQHQKSLFLYSDFKMTKKCHKLISNRYQDYDLENELFFEAEKIQIKHFISSKKIKKSPEFSGLFQY